MTSFRKSYGEDPARHYEINTSKTNIVRIQNQPSLIENAFLVHTCSVTNDNEHRISVFNIPVLYSGGPLFESHQQPSIQKLAERKGFGQKVGAEILGIFFHQGYRLDKLRGSSNTIRTILILLDCSDSVKLAARFCLVPS